jgi:hypothetical protein
LYNIMRQAGAPARFQRACKVMNPETRRYYEHRVEEQLELAQQSNQPEVVKAHYRLADLYLDLLFPPERQGVVTAH